MTFSFKGLRPRASTPLVQIPSARALRLRQLHFAFPQQLVGKRQEGWRREAQGFYQAASLRMSRLTRFAAVGALGTVVNLLVMALLVHGTVGINYVAAAMVAAEVSILHNFVLQERFVFRDLRGGGSSWRSRMTQHQLFNNAEALVRLPVLMLLVERLHLWSLLAQAVTLAVAFVARFLFTSRVVYRPEAPRVKGEASQ